MSIYVILGKLTQKAIEQMKGFSERDAGGEEFVRALGGKMPAHTIHSTGTTL